MKMKMTLAVLLLFIPFITPIFFQVIMGLRNLKNKSKLKIWQITVLSIIIMLTGVALLDIFAMRPATARTHDGLGYVALVMFMVITSAIVLIIMAVQFIVKHKRTRVHSVTRNS